MTFFQNGILGVSVQPIFQLISRGAALHMQNFDERQALDGLRSFDSQTIGAIYDKYFPEIYRYVRYRLNDEHLAEDIASDVFMRMLEAAQSGLGPQTNLKAWLISTASHIITDHLRRDYRRPADVLSENMLDPTSAPADEFDRREQARNFRHDDQADLRLALSWRRILRCNQPEACRNDGNRQDRKVTHHLPLILKTEVNSQC